jgi:uncharacterized membrane protein
VDFQPSVDLAEVAMFQFFADLWRNLTELSIDFNRPWWLLLLLLAPVIWVWSYRSLSGLGTWRRLSVLSLRTAVLVLIVACLAEVQKVQVSNRLSVIYLLDQSQSIPITHRQEMIRYVNAAAKKHKEANDSWGVIVFGKDAAVELPPFDDPEMRLPLKIESLIDTEFTNLEGAMKLAQAAFKEDSAKRIVIVSDGNQNLGNALDQAQVLAKKGIGIDVVPIRYSGDAEVLIDKVVRPVDVRKGQPFDLKAVVTNTSHRDIPGRLVFKLRTDNEPVVLNSNENLAAGEADPQRVVLKPGKNVFSVRQELEQPNFYEYEVEFFPDRKQDDGMVQNNRASTFTHVRGSGQVLFIENYEHLGEHAFLIDRLRANNLEVTVRPSDNAFSSLAELQQYDTVVIANVPRGGDEMRGHLTEEQVKMLVNNTEHMGAGLVMLGGEHAFGAGGWVNSELEKAMPLEFQIRNAKVMPKGALVMCMHASETANGNFWMKIIAREAIKTLGPQDYCGMLHWSGSEQWLWNHPKGFLPVGENRDKMIARLDRMMPGDMPDFDPTMKMALRAFNGLQDAAIKHMIIISDGDPSPPSDSLLKAFVDSKVTISTVAVGAHGPAESATLQRVANRCGGKYYAVSNNKVLPRIFQKEARRVARPLIYDKPPPFTPVKGYPHEMISGIDALPPISGYVMTTIKKNPLVEVSLLAPQPADRENALLASWTYGLGKAVCFTSDAGSRWTNSWTNWEGYDKFFTQMIRWSMRPAVEEGKFTVSTDVVEGKIRVVVTALDKDDNFLNYLTMAGKALAPSGEARDFKIQQVAPGRYVGELEVDDEGSYFMMISTGPNSAPLRAGVNVPYSSEFRIRGTDDNLLTTLASLKPEGGKPGKLIDADTDPPDVEQLLKINPFRRDLPKAVSSQDWWHVLVLIGSCLFFLDVFVRRVQVNLDWLKPVVVAVRTKVLGQKVEPQPSEYLSRLRSRKKEVREEIEQRRAVARFEPTPEMLGDTSAIESELAGTPAAPPKPDRPASQMTPQAEAESYTDRLLKAKKKVWEERKK